MIVTDEMVSAAMPWLTYWQHMRQGDRREAVRNALAAALAIGALERREDKTPPQLSEAESVDATPVTPENIEAASVAGEPYREGFRRGYRAKEEELENDLPEETVGLGEEGIARIIDEGAFVTITPALERLLEEPVEYARMLAKRREIALAKARLILSALPVGGK